MEVAKPLREVVAVDIGGTHARFALAQIHDRHVVGLSEPVVLRTADYDGLEAAWDHFARRMGRSLPRAAGIAIAGTIHEDEFRLTNNEWIIRPGNFHKAPGVARFALVNDFVAVGHAISQLGDAHFLPLCGPEKPFPAEGVLSIVGPGTGLGVAAAFRREGGVDVVASEGGHIAFAPLDPIEDAILARLRERFGRVSVERLVAGPGLAYICDALAGEEGRSTPQRDDKEVWTAALEGGDPLLNTALDRFCMILGAVAGDIALVHGACGVVIGGGLGVRLAGRLPASDFGRRFTAKGRFERLMREIPVKILTHPQPGLIGAAAAYAAKYDA